MPGPSGQPGGSNNQVMKLDSGSDPFKNFDGYGQMQMQDNMSNNMQLAMVQQHRPQPTVFFIANRPFLR